MKNINTLLNVVLLVAVGILFFLHFDGKGGNTTIKKNNDTTTSNGSLRIAYFNMDSLEKQYHFIQDAKGQLKAKEQNMTGELDGMKKNFTNRVQQLQAKEKTMTQEEGASAQQEIQQMQQTMQQKQASMSQSLQEDQFKMMQDIGKNIEDYLKTFNQQKKYTFIFSHSQGDFMYYKDSTNNITNELVTGLNAGYKKK